MPENIVQVEIRGDQTNVNDVLNQVAASVEAQTVAMKEGFATLTEASVASSEAIVAATKRTERAVEEEAESIGLSLREAGNHFTEFAERANIAQLGAFNTFGAIGGLFGGGLLVAGIGEAINKVREMDVEMEHLGAATGVPIEKIAELKSTVEEFGAPADSIDKVLARLSRSMVLASQGGKQASEAFAKLGVETKSWSQELPTADEVLLQVATHMQDSTHTAQDLGSAMTVMGRGVTSLTAVLHEGREELEKHMQSHAEYGAAVKASADSAMKLTELEHNLGEAFKNLALDVLPGVVTGIKVLYSALEYVAEIFDGVIAAGLFLGQVIGKYLTGSIEAFNKIIHGDFAAANRIASDTFKGIAEAWGTYSDTITNLQADTKAKIDAIWADPVKIKPTGETDIDPAQFAKANKAKEKELETEAAHQEALARLRENAIREEFTNLQISATQRLNLLNQSAEQELAIQQAILEKKKALYAKNDPSAPEAFAAIAGESVKLNDQYNATKQKNNEEFISEWKHKAEEGFAETNRLYEEDLKTFQRVTIEKEKSDREAALTASRVAELGIQASERLRVSDLENERRHIDQLYQFHQISELQKIQLTQATYDKEYALEISAVNREIAALDTADKQYLVKKQELFLKIVGLQDKANTQSIASSARTLTTVHAQYEKFFGQIGQVAQNQFQLMIQGQRSFAQGFANIGTSILASWEQTLLSMVLKKAEKEAIMLAMHFATKEEEVGIDAGAAAQSNAISAASSLKEIAHHAATAAAAAFKAVAGIPIIGPVLAPIAAGGAFAAVLAFGASVSAEQGAILPNQETLVHAHPNEMMLPAPISQGLQNVIGSGSLGGKSKGGHTMNLTYNHYDQGGRLTDGQINENADRLLKQVKTKFNRMNIGVRA